MKISILCAALLAACHSGGAASNLVTNDEALCKAAVTAGQQMIGTWLVQIGDLCQGSMRIDSDDPVPSGVYGCSNRPGGAPTYAGTVRIGPSASGVGLFFTAQGFMEGQVMRGTLSVDGKTLSGTFDANGDGPAMGAVFTATREGP